MAAKARGISYDELVGRMLDLAVDEWRRRRGGRIAGSAGAHDAHAPGERRRA
jgi:hypothetical protein